MLSQGGGMFFTGNQGNVKESSGVLINVNAWKHVVKLGFAS
jgi:hypothetical protein